MQVMTYQASHADILFVAPQLAWDAVWLAILFAGAFRESSIRATKRVEVPVTS